MILKVLQCAAQEGHKGVILCIQNRLKHIIKRAYVFLINIQDMVNDFDAKSIFARNTNSCYHSLFYNCWHETLQYAGSRHGTHRLGSKWQFEVQWEVLLGGANDNSKQTWLGINALSFNRNQEPARYASWTIIHTPIFWKWLLVESKTSNIYIYNGAKKCTCILKLLYT